jgi:pathogenesis-related protein 1
MLRTKMPLLWILAVIPPAAWAQTNDGTDLLTRIRENVMDTVTRLPRYMCSLKIERAQYAAAPGHARDCDGMAAQHQRGQIGRLQETDRVRLDVAIGDGNEIYSWVGENRFDDREVFDMVRAGALQDGGYAVFLASIFGGDAADFTYDGPRRLDGRTLAEFRFRVPHEKSNYHYFGNRRQPSILAAYGGSFFADPNTADLVRLVIHTSDLPEESGACEATTTLDYVRTRLRDADFLLPRQAGLDILQTDASDFHNSTAYSSCHEFQGKSALTFDAPATEAASIAPAEKPPPIVFTLPAGTAFKIVFTQAIDTSAAAAGDRVKAKLAAAIIDHSTKTVLAPAGAEIAARIIRMEHFPQEPRTARMLVRLETVEIGGNPRPFSPEMNSVAQLPVVVVNPTPRRLNIEPLTQTIASFDALTDPNIGSFYFRNVESNFVIRAGLESTWMAAIQLNTQSSTLLVTETLATEMLAAHNAVRSNVGVPPLTWSGRLADMAQNWANTLLKRNQLVHHSQSKVGENLFDVKGPDAHASASEVVQAWASESHGYMYKQNQCLAGAVCGHYTQLVWRTTKEVGCAVAKSRTREIWVCNYDPPGNWVGVRPY